MSPSIIGVTKGFYGFRFCTHLVWYALMYSSQEGSVPTGPCVIYMRSVAYLQPGFVERILQSIIHCDGVSGVVAPDFLKRFLVHANLYISRFSGMLLHLHEWLVLKRKLALHYKVIRRESLHSTIR